MYDRNDRGNRRAQRSEAQQPAEETEGQLEGRNAITEALKSGRTIDKLFIASGDTDKSLQRLAAQAKEAGAVIVPVDRRKLDAMSFTHAHQGVIALAAAHAYRKQVKNCPYEHDSHRSDMRDVLHRLEEMNPEARYSLWASMTNVQEELLPPKI